MNPQLIESTSNRPVVVQSPPPAVQRHSPAPEFSRRLRLSAAAAILLVLCFIKPLYDLVQFAVRSELYSHILLMPFITGYLIWLERKDLPRSYRCNLRIALVPFLAGIALLAAYFLGSHSGWRPSQADYLACMTLSFLLFALGIGLSFLGTETLRAIAFPVTMLIFMVPFPGIVERGLETFFQQRSADAAYLMFKLSGLPVFRQGTEFQLPGFSLQVAPQCSGIHSSLVLFITSLLAGYLLLRTPWAKGALALAVIPLGLLRNGFRVGVIGNLCVRLSPDWINSDLHHRGGPIFFAASLVPFFLLLLLLRKAERHTRGSKPAHRASPAATLR